ncbi:hypothetical protein [Caballeronia arationis]|uniref:hypothetical protein n=1 Tax=Caballeronia arationis TaxID=1777142 RepID=UPI0011982823|nr:hypothetical protein [Caballeronia arationis]
MKRSSHEIGEAGEAVAQAKLRTTLQWLCGDDFYLHDGPLLIEHAPGTAFPTAEIDHLASRARAAVLMYAETSANSLLDDKTR